MKRCWSIAVFCLAVQSAVGADRGVTVLEQRPEASAAAPSPIVYWHESRTEPRPLQIHIVRLDLHAKRYEVTVIITDDPDGEGGAEATLEKPLPLAMRRGAIAAVNANSFDLFPPPQKGDKRNWKEHAPAVIEGWAKDGTHQASPPAPVCRSFWLDAAGRGHIGSLKSPVEARLAVAGFGPLVTDGKLADTKREPLHPRTAVGLDRDGWTVWLVVVDGRQSGYSEGMATGELAAFMYELGCWDAMNMDGGGSSVMLVAKDGQALSVVNRPSDTGTRPIPVMLAVRAR